jgi:tRNA threonylcarbamoyladenosine biosynthesis protein TsaE
VSALIPIRCATVDDTLALGRRLGLRLRPGDVLVLTGDLGAGKTVLAKGLAAGLGVVEAVTSPTFAIVQEYDGRTPVVHVDFFRLDAAAELFEIGFEELLDRDAVFLIEWGERFSEVLPRRRLHVQLRTASDSTREVVLDARGPGWDWLGEVAV